MWTLDVSTVHPTRERLSARPPVPAVTSPVDVTFWAQDGAAPSRVPGQPPAAETTSCPHGSLHQMPHGHTASWVVDRRVRPLLRAGRSLPLPTLRSAVPTSWRALCPRTVFSAHIGTGVTAAPTAREGLPSLGLFGEVAGPRSPRAPTRVCLVSLQPSAPRTGRGSRRTGFG